MLEDNGDLMYVKQPNLVILCVLWSLDTYYEYYTGSIDTLIHEIFNT